MEPGKPHGGALCRGGSRSSAVCFPSAATGLRAKWRTPDYYDVLGEISVSPAVAPSRNQTVAFLKNQSCRIPLLHTIYHTSAKRINNRPNTSLIPVNQGHWAWPKPLEVRLSAQPATPHLDSVRTSQRHPQAVRQAAATSCRPACSTRVPHGQKLPVVPDLAAAPSACRRTATASEDDALEPRRHALYIHMRDQSECV